MKINANAWLVDGTGAMWVLAGPDPAGTPMGTYFPVNRVRNADFGWPGDVVRYRALRIEDDYGIARRGPHVTIEVAP